MLLLMPQMGDPASEHDRRLEQPVTALHNILGEWLGLDQHAWLAPSRDTAATCGASAGVDAFGEAGAGVVG